MCLKIVPPTSPATLPPIPGLLAPFAFNPVQNVLLALLFAAIGGS